MKSKMFGTLVAGAVAGMLSGAALAETGKATKATEKKGEGKAAATEGWCKANSCSGTIKGAKNSCAGEAACKGVSKADCEKDGHGTWTTEKKPS